MATWNTDIEKDVLEFSAHALTIFSRVNGGQYPGFLAQGIYKQRQKLKHYDSLCAYLGLDSSSIDQWEKNVEAIKAFAVQNGEKGQKAAQMLQHVLTTGQDIIKKIAATGQSGGWSLDIERSVKRLSDLCESVAQDALNPKGSDFGCQMKIDFNFGSHTYLYEEICTGLGLEPSFEKPQFTLNVQKIIEIAEQNNSKTANGLKKAFNSAAKEVLEILAQNNGRQLEDKKLEKTQKIDKQKKKEIKERQEKETENLVAAIHKSKKSGISY